MNGAPFDCCTHCTHEEPRPHETPCSDCEQIRAEAREAERQRCLDVVRYHLDAHNSNECLVADLLDGAS